MVNTLFEIIKSKFRVIRERYLRSSRLILFLFVFGIKSPCSIKGDNLEINKTPTKILLYINVPDH